MTLPTCLANKGVIRCDMEASKCPTCDAKLNGAALTEAAAEDKRNPIPGDYTICMYCRQVARFGDNLQLRALTEEDMLEMPTHMLSLMQLMLNEV